MRIAGKIIRFASEAIIRIIVGFRHQIPGFLVRVFVFYWGLVNRSGERLPSAILVNEKDGMKLLPTRSAEECRIEAGVGVVWIKSLSFERHAPLSGAF